MHGVLRCWLERGACSQDKVLCMATTSCLWYTDVACTGQVAPLCSMRDVMTGQNVLIWDSKNGPVSVIAVSIQARSLSDIERRALPLSVPDAMPHTEAPALQKPLLRTALWLS